ncbi:unnamed protein product [Sphagnum compactum]
MAGRKVNRMGVEEKVAHVFTARNLLTAKDVLCKTELELMELLDVPMEALLSAVAFISQKVCPPCHSVLDIMKERAKTEPAYGHLPTGLQGLDGALWGGIPFGIVTEVVGPAGIGKTQLCLMLSALTSMPEALGGLNSGVIYIDTEHKFTSGRLIEIAHSLSPEVLGDNLLQQLAAHVLVLHPSSVADLLQRLQGLEEAIIEHRIKLLVIDSIAALVLSEYGRDRIIQRQEVLGQLASVLKFLAESFRMPVVVTNQVRAETGFGGKDVTFTDKAKSSVMTNAGIPDGPELQLTAALGTKWAHSVNIRLIMESISGERFIKIAKSPLSATLAFQYEVTLSGIQQKGRQTFEASDGGKMTIQNSG